MRLKLLGNFQRAWLLFLALLGANVAHLSLRGQTVVESGDLIVANYSAAAGAVSRISPITGATSLLGSFVLPTATALASNGCLYVTEWAGAVRCIRLSDGLVTTLSCSVPLSQLWGIAVSDTGDLFLTSASGNRVIRLNPATGIGSVITSGGNLQSPTGIAFLDSSNLVVSSQLNSQIVKISATSGTQTLISAPPNTLNQPWGIAVNAGSLYVGAHDSRQLQRIAGNSLSVVGVVDLAPLGIAVASNGDVYAGIADILQSVYKIQRVAADGTTLGYFSGPLIGQATGLTIAPQTIQAQSQTNTPPEIAPIADIVVGEGEIVSFTATATDANWPLQSVRFSLDPGSPAGVSITPDGSVSWIPTEAQGPGLYTLTLRATDDGVPQASSTRTVLVNVIEVNSAPVLSAITNRVITAGSSLSFQAQASDADLPANLLTFSLLAGAPTNALISSSGLFSWTPSSSQAPGTNLIKVKVSDNGFPSLSATQSFTVTVAVPLTIQFSAALTNGLAPLSVAFTNLSTGATNYAWSFGDGKTSTATHPQNIYTNAGIYTVTLTAKGPGGSNSITRNSYIVATNLPPPTVNFIGSATSGLAPLSVSFTNLTTGATNYSWSFGDGKTSTSTHPQNIYTNSGIYSVSLTARGPGGSNTLTISSYITVNSVFSISNTAGIKIPSLGSATPYPSQMLISNLNGVISGMSVTLSGLTHTSVSDIDVLLVGPGGQKTYLISDAGTGSASGINLTFDDRAQSYLPQTALASGTSKPTNYDVTTDTFASPAPSAPYVTNLFTLNGTSPNGLWQLFVSDDTAGASGRVASWSMTFALTPRIGTALPATLDVNPAAQFPLILEASFSQGFFALSFNTAPSLNYMVQTTESLNSGSWRNLQIVAGDGTLHTLFRSNQGETHSFYRIVVWDESATSSSIPSSTTQFFSTSPTLSTGGTNAP